MGIDMVSSLFRLAQMQGSPYSMQGPGQVYQSIAAQMQPTQTGVFVTPNTPETQAAVSAINPVPTGANKTRQALARQMIATGSSTAPVQSPLEGLARALQAGIGGYMVGQENRAQQAREDAISGNVASMLGFTPEQAEGLSPEQLIATRAAMTPKEGNERWRPATAEEVQAANLPEGAWLISSRGKFRDPTRAQQQTTIDLGGTYDEKAAERRAMSDQDYRTELRTQANTARGKIPAFRRLKRLISKDPGSTGALQPVKRWASSMFEAFGQDPEEWGLPDAGDAQQVRALTNRMVMDSLDAFSGALSEKELAFAEAASASESLTPEANLALIGMMETAARRQIEQYSMLRKWNRQYGSPSATNDKGQDFEDMWDAYLQEQGEGFEPPEVTTTPEDPEVETTQAGAGETPDYPESFTDPATGVTYRLDPEKGKYVRVD